MPAPDPSQNSPVFASDGDWYGYQYSGSYFVIVDRAGEELIGDQLPSSEEEARWSCRVANAARAKAVKFMNAQLAKLKFT